ncbi:sensor histidine kinase [Niallia sp. 01092]|uniref:sensor histidine kinase n=1 Tax=Niallia sp. 01092 TaxID=3457759 RepID=UPI003FD43D78
MIRTLKFSNRFVFKIILVFLFVILFPTFILSFAFNIESTSVVKKNVRENTIQIAKQTAESLSFIFKSGSDTSDLIFSSTDIQASVMNINRNEVEEQGETFQYMNSMLNQVVYSNSFVENVYVWKEGENNWAGSVFSPYMYNSSMYKLIRMRASDQEWIEEAKQKDGGLVWQELQYDRLIGGGANTELILPIGRVLKNFKDRNRIGFIQVNLNGRSILNVLDQLQLGKTGKFFVVDSEGKIMIHPDLKLINKRVEIPNLRKHIMDKDFAEFEYTLNKTPYYGIKQPLSNGWMIVGTVPVHEITGELDRLQIFLFISSGFLALFSIVVGLLMVDRITEPINQLALDMQKVKNGDLTVRTNVRSNDEIGLLSEQFNSMLEEIEQLISQVKEEQGEKLQAKLRAAMHRIHPHFLLNTLNMLWWFIKSNENDRASLCLKALIRLLDSHMGKSGIMITLEEELDFLKKYIAILEMRYEKSFVLDIDVDAKAKELVIPRMLLQPLVENAIFHGIVPKETDGRIRIHVRTRRRGYTEFIVSDNGLGISKEKIKILSNQEEAIAKGEMGIGLLHVYDTLRFYYARCSKWIITSSLGEGTTVRIILGKPLASDSQEGKRKAE